jgi:predicted N-formylglutamate amidohydrolase
VHALRRFFTERRATSKLASCVLMIVSPDDGLRRYAGTKVTINDPYGRDGPTHTLKEHAIKVGHLNVMLEIRNE